MGLASFICAAFATTHTAQITVNGYIDKAWEVTSNPSASNSIKSGTAANRAAYGKEICNAFDTAYDTATNKVLSGCSAVFSEPETARTNAPKTTHTKVVLTMTFLTDKTTAAAAKTAFEALYDGADKQLTITSATAAFGTDDFGDNPTLKASTTTAAPTTTAKSGAIEVCASISMMILGFMNV